MKGGNKYGYYIADSTCRNGNAVGYFFGTTTEAIMENAPSFLRSYGWYTMVEGLPITLLVTSIVSVLFIGIVVGLFVFVDDYNETYDIDVKRMIKYSIVAAIIPHIIVIGIQIALCAISPEIVGLKALLAILK